MDRMIEYGEMECVQMKGMIQNEEIYPVYQPIVSLTDGSIYGYEGLSRIDQAKYNLDICDLFSYAEQNDILWELESVCRKKTLEQAKELDQGVQLFINVDPLVIEDQKFRDGFTRKILKEHNMSSDRIIFEITEKNSSNHPENFSAVIQHYKNEKFRIAIDDFGEGYAGVNRVCSLMPEFLKLDIAMVRNINQDTVKQTIVKNIVKFCNEINIMVIAEGIETKEELAELIRLNVNYGQGFLLGRPVREFRPISDEIINLIKRDRAEYSQRAIRSDFFGSIGEICKKKDVCKWNDLSKPIYERMVHDPTITEVCVLDEDQHVKGMILRTQLLEQYGGRYGYTLTSKKNAVAVSNVDILIVDHHTPIDKVSQMALERPVERLYDAVVVTEEAHYKGIVTVKDLLQVAMDLQVKRASESNPLTGLPGNCAIEEKIYHLIGQKSPFSIIYLDIDNFKAYNDVYGFNSGDKMIKMLAAAMDKSCQKDEFKGHIGGDDFVIITSYQMPVQLCRSVIHNFSLMIQSLYQKRDWERHYIVAKNRHGLVEHFPIATLSVAAITNQSDVYDSMDKLSQVISETKRECKQQGGNYYLIR